MVFCIVIGEITQEQDLVPVFFDSDDIFFDKVGANLHFDHGEIGDAAHGVLIAHVDLEHGAGLGGIDFVVFDKEAASVGNGPDFAAVLVVL